MLDSDKTYIAPTCLSGGSPTSQVQSTSLEKTLIMNGMKLTPPMLFLSVLVLLSQYEIGHTSPGPVSREHARILSSLLGEQKRLSQHPMFDDNNNMVYIDSLEVIDKRNITLSDFGPGYAVEGTFTAPSAGRVTMNLMDAFEENIIFHVDARYNWNSSYRVLVLNSMTNGEGWGEEKRSFNFDFTSGIEVTVRVEANDLGFTIFCNDQESESYNHRLDVTAVRKIQMIYEDYSDNEFAKLESLAVFFP